MNWRLCLILIKMSFMTTDLAQFFLKLDFNFTQKINGSEILNLHCPLKLPWPRQFPKIAKLSGTHLVVYRSGLDEHYSDLSEPWSSSGELFCSRKWRAEIWYPGETFQNNFFELLTYPIAEQIYRQKRRTIRFYHCVLVFPRSHY